MSLPKDSKEHTLAISIETRRQLAEMLDQLDSYVSILQEEVHQSRHRRGLDGESGDGNFEGRLSP